VEGGEVRSGEGLDDYARNVFARAGLSPEQGLQWVNHGFGPLVAETMVKLGVSLPTAVRGRALGLDSTAYRAAQKRGVDLDDCMNAADTMTALVAAMEARLDAVSLLRVPLTQRDESWTLMMGLFFRFDDEKLTRLKSAVITPEMTDLLERLDQPLNGLVAPLAAGEPTWDALWRAVGIDSDRQTLWQSIHVDVEEAYRRIRDHHWPIDAFDGVPIDVALDRNRDKESITLDDHQLTVSRSSGRPVPPIAASFSDEEEAIALLKELGFFVAVERLHHRFRSVVGSSVVVQARTGGTKWTMLGAVDIDDNGIGVRHYREPAEHPPVPVASLRDALEVLTENLNERTTLKLSGTVVTSQELLHTLNHPAALIIDASISFGKIDFLRVNDVDGQVRWVPTEPLETATDHGDGLFSYGGLAVSYPGPYALGICDFEEARRRWQTHTPVAWVESSYHDPVAIRLIATGYTADDDTDDDDPILASGATFIECITALLHAEPDLQLCRDACLIITTRADQAVDRNDLIVACRESSPAYSPAGEKYTFDEPTLFIDGGDYVAVPFDDNTFDLVAPINGDTFVDVLASLSEIEWASRTSGTSTRSVGRLSTGAVVYIQDLDEDAGDVIAVRAAMSDVDAVADWLESISDDPHDYIGIARAIYADGRTIDRLSDFDDSKSRSYEIAIDIRLDEKGFRDLWARFEADHD
jgi:hypothetical protein